MINPSKKLFLLDAMALIYRAHFAFSKSPRISSKGLNTGAILGFTNSLVEILNKEKPSHIGVAFDTMAPTFRHTAFPEYKAQRQEQPEDIRTAIPYVKEIVRAFNIPVLELDSYEADDIIGTLAKKCARNEFTVYMMTPDKDFGQLVEEKVFLYKPAYMGNAVDILGVKEVLEKWQINHVDQVRDILGLQGDAVDNIPGIPGIGPKTASKLIQDYGTVENLVQHAEELKGKCRDNVIEFGQQGILSKELATINIDVPISCEIDNLEYKGPDEEKLKVLFQELEFRTLMQRVLGDTAKPAVKVAVTSGQMSLFGNENGNVAVAVETETAVVEVAEKENIYTTPHDYHIINTSGLRKSLIKYLLLQDEFCFDTEATGVDPFDADLIGMSFSYLKGEAYYVPIPLDEEQARAIVQEFKEVFENEQIAKTGQNLKYDMLMLQKYGVEVKGKLFDTMLAHYLLEPDKRHNMDILAETYLNYSPVPIEELIGKKGVRQGNMKDVPLEKIAEYAGEDADITYQLKDKLAPLIRAENQERLLLEVEVPLIDVLTHMEYEGVRVDTNTLKELSLEMEKESFQLEEEIYQIAGEKFNISSPQQLGKILFEKLMLDSKPKKTKSGQYATGEEILSRMASEHILAKKILEYREVIKLKSTYIDSLPDLISPRDGRIHTCYNQAVAATGRLSSTNPNLQNIPIRTEKGREIRKAFIPRNENYLLLSADYSQIELRIMASFAKDESMIDAFRNGRDIHTTTASKIFKVAPEEVTSDLRRKAKTANFGIIYGISAFGLSQRLDIPRKEANDIIEAYFKEFPAVKRYMDNIVNEAREKEYVETVLGRKRYLRDINSRNITMRGYAERNAINAPIQGSAADMIKMAMIRIHQWMKKEKLKSKMILQVHDELVFDAHQSEIELLKEKVEFHMKHALELEVPMEVGLGTGVNWLAAH